MESKLYIMSTDILYNRFYSYLSNYRKAKTDRLKRREDRNLSVASGLLIDYGLRMFGLTEKEMRYIEAENGKLQFKFYPEICFNLSYAGRYVVCAFSPCSVGCDIEELTNIKYQMTIAKQFFCRAEYLWILEQIECDSAFCRIWSLKESYLKATGLGLSAELGSFCILPDELPTFHSELDGGTYFAKEYPFRNTKYCISCCCKGEFLSSVLQEVDFNKITF